MVLEKLQGSRWFRSYNQKLVAIATPIAFLLAVLPLVIGFFTPQIAGVYLINAYIMVFLTIFGVCLALRGFHNQAARRLVFIVAGASFLGALAHYWLLIETVFFGFPIMYPNVSAYITIIANLILLVGFIVVSVEQRRRSKQQITGYLLITFFFAACILSTYQMNLIFEPPILPAIGTGVRILLGFFTAIFAWAFYFNTDPSQEVISRFSRLMLVVSSLFLILGYTAFAYQYAMSWQAVSVFYYAGSLSDSVTLFAIFFFLISVLTIFGKTLENMATIRPMSVKYEDITRVLLLLSLLVVMTLIATITVSLTSHVLLVFLSPMDAMFALQSIGIGLLIGFVIVGLIVGGIGYFFARLIYQPLEQLEIETSAVTEPGLISYQEPAGLVFTELQGISDNFTNILNVLSRVRTELRRFTVIERRPQAPSKSQLVKLDYYLGILNNSITSGLQSILSLSEVGQSTSNPEERLEVLNLIHSEINKIQNILQSVQLLRLVDIQALPEFSRTDLGSVITQIINELHTLFPESVSQISLSLPGSKAFVLVNEYVTQIFRPLFQLVMTQVGGGSTTIGVTFSEVTELGIEYWQVEISHPKWVLSDLEKVLLFREDVEQPQKANPNLLLVPALVEYYRGKFRVTNIVIDDPQYGTLLQVLLPKANQSRVRKPRKVKKELGAD
ncbi:MAG: hypothetical protein ACFE9D_12355 [Promethearchaeota archaeon]